MKYLISVILWCFIVMGSGFAAYAPTTIDVQLVTTFSATITQMNIANPAKVASITPKLALLVNMYSEDTREYYVLNALYMHMLWLVNMPSSMIAETIVVDINTTNTNNNATATTPTNTTTVSNTSSVSTTNTQNAISDPLGQRLVDLVNNHYIKWNPEAQFSIIEFIDFQCPFCQQYHIDGTLDAVIQQYNWEVNVLAAHFPLGTHPLAYDAANAAECIAAQWWDMAFYGMKNELFRAGNFYLQPTRSNLMTAFDTLNPGTWDKASYETCVDNNTYTNKVTELKQLGRDVWVTGTPTNIFLNNRTGQYKVVPWSNSVDAWTDIIAELEPSL